MKKYAMVMVLAVGAIAAVLIIQGRSPEQTPAPTPAQSPTARSGGSGQEMAFAGKVLETMNSGGYTYVHVDTGEEKLWAAGPETTVETGAVVAFAAGMPMKDFNSETLNRTFESIMFVPEISLAGAASQVPMDHPPVNTPDIAAEGMDFSGIAVPGGGKNIAALYAEKSGLAGKEVVVRGRVVKFTPNIMDRNWVHIRDGSGGEGSNDLTVTTNSVVKVGDIVVARGSLVLDQNFGHGYEYPVLMENAKLTVE